MRKLFVAAATVAIFALLVTPAFAAKGGGKGNGGGSQQVVGGSSILSESYSQYWRGGYVGFETNAVGPAGWEHPMVGVWCYQDMNGDGVRMWLDDGGDLVWMELRHPTEEFLLGGGSSDWVRNLGSADAKRCSTRMVGRVVRSQSGTWRPRLQGHRLTQDGG